MLDKFNLKKTYILKLIHLNYHQFVSHRFYSNLTLIKYNTMSSDICCRGYIETIMENQLFWISCHNLLLVTQIKIYQSIQTGKILKLKLCPCIIIVPSESIRHEIIVYSDFTVSIIFQFRVKNIIPVFQTTT